MTSNLLELVEEARHPDVSFEWQTPRTMFPRLAQVTDGYVVHARGFTVGEDIWLDKYALNGGHKRWWNGELQEEYPGKDWDDDNVLYWSVTGAPAFILQHPRVPEMDSWQVGVLMEFLDAFRVGGEVKCFPSDGEQTAYRYDDLREAYRG